MFQLFKQRDFGELFNDTFSFFKQKGKNYLGNYLKVTALFLVLLVVLIFIMSKFYFGVIFSGLDTAVQNDYMEQYFENNIGLILGMGALIFIVIVLISLIQISYPVFYLKLLENNGNYQPKASEISKQIRQNFGKLVVFFLLTFFIVGIASAIALTIATLLIFVLIGLFLLLILVPYINGIIYLSFYHYMSHRSIGYFDALGFAFSTIHNNFWRVIGSNLLITVIIQILVSIISMIPYMFFFVSMFTTLSSGQITDPSDMSGMMYALAATYAVVLLISFLLNNIVIVNFGLIYYGERERIENRSARNELDEIGLDA